MDVGYIVPGLRGGGWRATVRDSLNWLLGVSQAYNMFSRAERAQANDDASFVGKNIFLSALQENRMTMDAAGLIDQIPANGPAIVVANHAFGGADAIALSGLCAQKRPDTRVLANAITAELPGISKWTIPLEILGEDGATHSNRSAMKQSLAVLRNGGILVVFPAGAVSRWRNDLGRVADPEWTDHVARLSTKTDTPVLPVRFFGRNPCWFEILGALHPIIRSALIVRVFLAASGQRVVFRAGKMIESHTLAKLDDVKEMTAIIREQVESIPEP